MYLTKCILLLNVYLLNLEHYNLSSFCNQEIIINSQKKDEGHKQARGRQEMPNVMVVKEVQVLTLVI